MAACCSNAAVAIAAAVTPGPTHVWREPLLYGAGPDQRYRAVREQDVVSSVYAVRRGNRKVYVHLQRLRSDVPLLFTAGADVPRALTASGHAVLHGTVPGTDGRLSSFALERLNALGGRLVSLVGLDVYVVCHTAPQESVGDGAGQLLDAAGLCADAAAAALQSGYDEALPEVSVAAQNNRQRNRLVRFVPFAAGPLLPRPAASRDRLELVVPERLWRD